MTLIDTSIWIEGLRSHGSQEVRDRVAETIRNGQAAWCPVIRLELWAGVGNAEERKALNGLFGVVEDLAASDDVWKLAIQLADIGRGKGHTFPIPDLIVFATSRIHGATLWHRDKHFETLKTLSPV